MQISQKNFTSVKEPLLLGGQDLHKQDGFFLAHKLVKYFEQLSLRKPTIKELFKLFGVIIIIENKFNTRSINLLAYVNFSLHWLCGAHQKLALIWWLFEQQFFYLTKQMWIINSGI